MRLRLFVPLLLILLAACNTAPAVTPTPIPSATPPPSATPVIVTMPPPEDLDNLVFSPTDYTLGGENAPVTIIHYGDFQCVPCADVARSLAIMLDEYPDTVRVIFRHLPDLVIHDKAVLAMMAVEAAGEQDAFWDMHDLLFAEQDEWIDQTPDEFRQTLLDYGRALELDRAAFEEALDRDPGPVVEQYRMEAAALELAGIPTLLINGHQYSGRYDRYGLDEAVRFFALSERHYDDIPPLVIDRNKTYRAILETEHGTITLDLFPDRALVAVNNFVFLARDGWFDDTTFHRVLPGLFAQAGDPSGTGLGGPGYTIAAEHDTGLIFDREGLVAMAETRGVANSGGSQFFITYGPLLPESEWNGQYTIFGIVADGMDVLRQLTPRDPQDSVAYPDPLPGDRLITVTIIEE